MTARVVAVQAGCVCVMFFRFSNSLAKHAQDNSSLLDLAALAELAGPKPLALSGAFLAVLVVLDSTIRQRVPLALARVHRRRHIVHVLQMTSQITVLVLAWLEGSTAHGAHQQLVRGRRC